MRNSLATRRGLLAGLVFGATASRHYIRPAMATTKGEFKGRIVTEFGSDGRTMIVVNPFEYVDPAGRRWPVPAGLKTDGASIPRVFWSFIGGPFVGHYRSASIVHDHYCETRTRRYEHVHRVFYDAMLTSGVDGSRAWFMWKAVERFGPRWDDPRIDPRCEIIDQDYDFKLCAQNTRPTAQVPPVTASELRDFTEQVKGEASTADVAELNRIIQQLR